jgi:hypothetical protein
LKQRSIFSLHRKILMTNQVDVVTAALLLSRAITKEKEKNSETHLFLEASQAGLGTLL